MKNIKVSEKVYKQLNWLLQIESCNSYSKLFEQKMDLPEWINIK